MTIEELAPQDVRHQAVQHTWEPRAETALLRDQLGGIEAWHAGRRAAEVAAAAADTAAVTREMRMDAARRLDVLRRQQQALIARTEQQMKASAHVLRSQVMPRAVLVHRNEWFKSKVAAGLLAGGTTVVADLENGADGIGVVVAEQPDLLLIEDTLPMMSGVDVIREVARFSPRTITAVQAASHWELGALLDAGAHAAFSRRVPPADVARDLCLLLTG